MLSLTSGLSTQSTMLNYRFACVRFILTGLASSVLKKKKESQTANVHGKVKSMPR